MWTTLAVCVLAILPFWLTARGFAQILHNGERADDKTDKFVGGCGLCLFGLLFMTVLFGALTVGGWKLVAWINQ